MARRLRSVLDETNLNPAMAKVLSPGAEVTPEESLEAVCTLIEAGEVPAGKAHGHSCVAVFGNTGEAGQRGGRA